MDGWMERIFFGGSWWERDMGSDGILLDLRFDLRR